MPKRWIAAGAAALCAAAGAAWAVSGRLRPAKPAGTQTRFVRVWSGVIEDAIRLTGVTAAENSASLMVPRLGGSRRGSGSGSSRSTSHDFTLTLDYLIPGGSSVKKGDLVATFDRQYMLNRLDDYRANVLQHEANLRSLQALLQVRRRAYDQRLRAAKGNVEKAALNLKTAPVRSAIQVERYRLALEEAQARYKELQVEVKYFDISERASIRRSELDLEESRLGLRRAETNLSVMELRSPIDGLAVIQTTHRGTEYSEIRQGDELRAGHRLLQIVDPRSIVIHALANQSDAELLRIGQKAHVHFDAFPGLVLPARVVSIGAFATSTGFRGSYIKQLPVRLKLLAQDPRVIPNFTVGADVVIASSPKAAILPREGIFLEGPELRPVAYVRSGETWTRRELELGLKNNIAAAVLSGLREGDVVAAERPRQTE
jgi:multidrug efflux pump subunit AcrA (membrane-fusion protein)